VDATKYLDLKGHFEVILSPKKKFFEALSLLGWSAMNNSVI